MSELERRMFYLMLSATDGQKFASSMGFATPSSEVQEMEIMEVISKWLLFVKTGIIEELMETSEWFSDFLEQNDKLVSPKEDFSDAIVVFTVAALSRMLENGTIGLIMDSETYEDLTDE